MVWRAELEDLRNKSSALTPCWVLGRWEAGQPVLGFAGLGPRQVAVRGGSAGRAGQWGRQVEQGLGSALLGWVLGRWQLGVARQAGLGSALLGWVLGRWQSGVARQAGLGSALLGWVLGRWQAGQGRGLGFAGLGPRQAAVRGQSAGRAGQGRVLGFAGLGLRQAAVRGGQEQPGLGLALLGWVLGRWQAARAGLGPRQVAAGWLGWADGAGRARRQAGGLGWAVWAGWGSQGRTVRLAGRAGARLGFAGLGPRQAGRVGLPGLVLAWLWLGSAFLAGRSGWAGWAGGAGRLQNELKFDQIDLLVTSSYYKDIEGDKGTALGSQRAFALRESRINLGVTEVEFCNFSGEESSILISAIDRGGIRLGVIGLAVAAAQVKQTLDPSTKTLAKFWLLRANFMTRTDSAKDGLKRLLSLEDSGGSIGIKGDRGGRYIREPSAEEELSPAGFGRWSREGQEAGLERSAKRTGGAEVERREMMMRHHQHSGDSLSTRC
ncbi:hypothetical protein BY996DRAFT_6446141 [Phakopsora pachyrhizi]|nr:hypothetical protein BY996DRAFT_6446141 [Phakopsora pachyrhizi]